MAKLVTIGRLSKEKFCESYLAFKNHISHGNGVKFGYGFDKMVHLILLEDA